MTTPHEYRARALECVRLAQQATERERSLLIQIAETWMRLADQTEAANKVMVEDV